MNTASPNQGTRAPGLLERRQDRRERKFRERRDQIAGMLPKLRNRAGRRRLVVLYMCSIAALFVAGIMLAVRLLGEDYPAWWGLPWAVCTVLLVGIWMMLFIVTDNIDGAPVSALDEYERERVEGLRSLAYQGFTWFGLVFSLGLLFFGVWLGESRPDWAADVPYLAGLAFLIPFLVLLSVPTAVIAWTMPDD